MLIADLAPLNTVGACGLAYGKHKLPPSREITIPLRRWAKEKRAKVKRAKVKRAKV
jgi:hypothetical protein